jgi:aryl-alcohol dehydrogenase-like predicted oxidoreductase
MNKINLTKDIKVAPVCLGAMNFGTTTSREASFAVLDAYVDAGGNFIDTSNNYAHWAGTGDESETLLGEWLRERGCRDKIILATKVGFDRHGEGAGLKREQIEYWIDESLRKLGTDYVDLYYAHTDDYNTPLEETMEAFDSLVKKGKVRVLGGSNYDTWRFADANCVAKDKSLAPFEVMQQKFTYLQPTMMAPKYIFNEHTSRERLRFLKDRDIPLVAYSCLAKGGYEKDDRLPSDYERGERLETIRNMAKEKGVCTSAMVVAWLVNLWRVEGMPRVIPLFASSSTEHFLDNLKGASLALSDEEMDILCKA